MKKRLLLPFLALVLAGVAALAVPVLAGSHPVQLTDGDYIAGGTLCPPDSGPIIWHINISNNGEYLKYKAQGSETWSLHIEWDDDDDLYARSGGLDDWDIWGFTGAPGLFYSHNTNAQNDSGTYESG